MDKTSNITQHAPLRIGDFANVRVEGHPEPVPMLTIHLEQSMNAGGGVALVAMRGAESENLARLFVTAPELLAELRIVYERSYNPFEPDNQSEQYKRVGALIAKATGEQA